MNKTITKRRHKYGARKTVSHGITFDSAAEAKYYPFAFAYATEHGYELRLQEAFELLPKHRRNGKAVRAVKYVPDFSFWEGGTLVKVVDVKGMQTSDFKIKAKWFCYRYDVDLTIAKYDYKTGLFDETVF